LLMDKDCNEERHFVGATYNEQDEVVPVLVELEVAVPRLIPALR